MRSIYRWHSHQPFASLSVFTSRKPCRSKYKKLIRLEVSRQLSAQDFLGFRVNSRSRERNEERNNYMHENNHIFHHFQAITCGKLEPYDSILICLFCQLSLWIETFNQKLLEVSWNSSTKQFTVQLVVLYSLIVKILLRPAILSYHFYSEEAKNTWVLLCDITGSPSLEPSGHSPRPTCEASHVNNALTTPTFSWMTCLETSVVSRCRYKRLLNENWKVWKVWTASFRKGKHDFSCHSSPDQEIGGWLGKT